MTTSSRIIRVFISSTFRDMQAERDYLVKFIFPQLRKLCESRGVTWVEVDLRWGITDEQSAEGKVLPICLAEIERSRPYFIGLLGERYGWIPDSIDPELVAQEPWLVEHKDHSVTELEILHGVLNDPEMAGHALFYFRDRDYLKSIDEKKLDDFIEVPWQEDIEKFGMAEAQRRVKTRKEKLTRLKERIRSSGLPLKENYRDPQQLGEWVLADLTAIIDDLFPEGEQPDPLAQEAMLHDTFAQSRARVYIGGEQYFSKIDAHLKESNQPLVLVGDSGSGKSALLANWGLRYQEDHPDQLVLLHFIGASAHSTNLNHIIRRLITELKQQLEIPEELPIDEKELRRAFANWLYMASAKGKVVLILDGLNQLDNRENAQELDWLPLELPENVNLLLSSLPGRAMDVVTERGWPTMQIMPLTMAEREEVIRKYLSLFSKQLSPDRVKRIMQDPQSENPFGLRLLLNELRQFGIHEELDQIIDHYLAADSIPDMVQLMLERLERDYENERPELVRDAMCDIWVARRGLSEAELLDLLGTDEKPLPFRIWSPLSLALESSLVDRGGLLGFSHDYIRHAVKERYLHSNQHINKVRIRLADYFASFEGTSIRKVDELPWHLAEAKAWVRLYSVLEDLAFFEALHQHSQTDLLTYWAAVETNTDHNRVSAYQNVVENPEGVKLHVLNWLSQIYVDSGYLEEAKGLLKKQELIYRQMEDKHGLQASLDNQANILYKGGKLDEAMGLLKEQERICREQGNQDGLQTSLGNQALILKSWGKLEKATVLLKEQELICRQLGSWNGLQASLGNQANILYSWGKLEEAMGLHKQKERICRQLGNLDSLQKSLGDQALILKSWGKLDEAMGLLKEQEHICRQLGNQYGLQASLGNQANILYSWGKLKEAMVLNKEQERICRQLGNLYNLQISLGNQANILHRWGELEEAMRLHKEEERICRHLGNMESLQRSLGNQGIILYSWGKLEKAMGLLKEQERICRQLGNIQFIGISLANQGRIYGKLGNRKTQLHLLKKALILLNDRGYSALASQIERSHARIISKDK